MPTGLCRRPILMGFGTGAQAGRRDQTDFSKPPPSVQSLGRDRLAPTDSADSGWPRNTGMLRLHQGGGTLAWSPGCATGHGRWLQKDMSVNGIFTPMAASRALTKRRNDLIMKGVAGQREISPWGNGKYFKLPMVNCGPASRTRESTIRRYGNSGQAAKAQHLGTSPPSMTTATGFLSLLREQLGKKARHGRFSGKFRRLRVTSTTNPLPESGFLQARWWSPRATQGRGTLLPVTNFLWTKFCCKFLVGITRAVVGQPGIIAGLVTTGREENLDPICNSAPDCRQCRDENWEVQGFRRRINS